MINFAKIWDILITKFPAFMEGVEITLQLAFFTVLFGSLLGLVVAVCRRTRLLPLRWLMNAYVAFIRGTPLLVQVLLVVYGLPQLGIRFPRMTLCIIALVINSGAYMAELIRAGLQSVPRAQWEAGISLGLGVWNTLRLVILPQAVRRMLPPLTSQLVSLIKDTSLVSSIAVADLTMQAQVLIADTFLAFEIWLIVAALYLALTLCVALPARWMERRYAWR